MIRAELIKIGGMHCDACVGRVRRALEAREGLEVKEVIVGEAVVERDDERVDQPLLRETIEAQGFKLLTVEPLQ